MNNDLLSVSLHHVMPNVLFSIFVSRKRECSEQLIKTEIRILVIHLLQGPSFGFADLI
jgi:hypothetical protein